MIKSVLIVNDHLLTQAKQDYFKTKIETAETSKDLYKVCDNLLNREQKSVLPYHDCVKDHAGKFITYFNDKISNIRKDLEKALISTSQTPQDIFNKFDGEVLDSFTEVSEDDVRKISHSSPTKSCALDPIPTWLLKKCEDELIPVLTRQPRPFATLYLSAWSKLHIFTLSRPGLKRTCSTKHIDSLYV